MAAHYCTCSRIAINSQQLFDAIGAERLVVDAAVETVKHGHSVGLSKEGIKALRKVLDLTDQLLPP